MTMDPLRDVVTLFCSTISSELRRRKFKAQIGSHSMKKRMPQLAYGT